MQDGLVEYRIVVDGLIIGWPVCEKGSSVIVYIMGDKLLTRGQVRL